MKQKDKELLLKDLCARLPYGVICKTSKGNGHLCSINQHIFGIEYGININATERDYFNDKEEIKPYLRPMSSMMEDETNEFYAHLTQLKAMATQEDITKEMASFVGWLNRKMFDWRGLIPADCAIEVTEDNNPYKD